MIKNFRRINLPNNLVFGFIQGRMKFSNQQSLIDLIPKIEDTRDSKESEQAQLGLISMKRANFKQFKNDQLSGKIFQRDKDLLTKIKKSENAEMLFKLYDNNRLSMSPPMYVALIKRLSIILPMFLKVSKVFQLMMRNNSKKFKMLSIKDTDRRLMSFLIYLEKQRDTFKFEEKLDLINYLSKISKFADIKYIVELHLIDIFRNSSDKIQLISTDKVVLILNSLNRCGVTNKKLIGLIVVEIDSRITRLEELELPVVTIDEKEEEQNFTPSSLINFLGTMALMNADDPETFMMLKEQILELNLLEKYSIQKLSLFVYISTRIPQFNKADFREELYIQLGKKREEFSKLKNSKDKFTLTQNLIKMKNCPKDLVLESCDVFMDQDQSKISSRDCIDLAVLMMKKEIIPSLKLVKFIENKVENNIQKLSMRELVSIVHFFHHLILLQRKNVKVQLKIDRNMILSNVLEILLLKSNKLSVVEKNILMKSRKTVGEINRKIDYIFDS